MKSIAYSRLFSCALAGLEGVPVEVEVSILPGIPHFEVSGRGDPAVREARDRVRAAICNSGYHFPKGRVIASYAPASLPKQGSAFDLPLALAILEASGQIVSFREGPPRSFLGELTLNGRVKPVKGMLGRLRALAGAGLSPVVGPREAEDEASLVDRIEYVGVRSLREAVESFSGIRKKSAQGRGLGPPFLETGPYQLDRIGGQGEGIRALTIAAAGWHPLLMLGAPGSGKSLLASSLIQLLPPLDREECLEVLCAYSAAGKERPADLIWQRPFRQSHHSVSLPALIGGGRQPVPGECSLAHRGVLFLDEMTEMSPRVLDALREPLEKGVVHLARDSWKLSFPSDFLLVAAANPCPCGQLLEAGSLCRCQDHQVHRRLTRISGPLYDRFDLVSILNRVDSENLTGGGRGKSLGEEIRRKIAGVWKIQKARSGCLNGRLPIRDPAVDLVIEGEAMTLAGKLADRAGLSARSFHSMLAVARTIADLNQDMKVGLEAVAEAFHFKAPLPWPQRSPGP